MFYKFLDQILKATTKNELYVISGAVDMEYQKENLSWKQYDYLIKIINKFCNYMQEV